MIKKVIDTNIFIDRFSSPDLYRGIFLSSGIVYLSSIVLMELRAGVHTKQAVRAIDEMFDFFRQVGRIWVPSITDYEKAGEIISKLQVSKGYNIKKSASITNDCLIAASVRSMGATLYTKNKKDFMAIQDVFHLKVMFV
ncbi:MAG TPA: PIN domain-containing protein [Thermodesulfovibrionales bacterium]|nr:PIN domain-containing protein [Thermodesulfovibrionales bacterium]